MNQPDLYATCESSAANYGVFAYFVYYFSGIVYIGQLLKSRLFLHNWTNILSFLWSLNLFIAILSAKVWFSSRSEYMHEACIFYSLYFILYANMGMNGFLFLSWQKKIYHREYIWTILKGLVSGWLCVSTNANWWKIFI